MLSLSNKISSFSTKYLLNIWFVFLLVAIEGVFIIDGPIFRTLFYLIGTFFFLYIFLSRYAAKVEIREDEILVKYFFFWDKDVSFPIGEIKSVDYEKVFLICLTIKIFRACMFSLCIVMIN
jgi:membrane protein YdbS with pleckstrin-like domain